MNLVTVATFPTITHLYVIKNQLEEAGIPCVVKDAYTVGTNPFYDVALGGIKLQVREEDAAEAQQMLWQLGYRPPVPQQDNTKQRHPLVKFVLFLLFFVAMLAVIFVLHDPVELPFLNRQHHKYDTRFEIIPFLIFTQTPLYGIWKGNRRRINADRLHAPTRSAGHEGSIEKRQGQDQILYRLRQVGA